MSGRARRGYPVTAWSTVNSLGTTTERVMSALRGGRASLTPPPSGTPFETVCGVVDIDLPALPKGLERFESRNNRFIQQALAEMGTALDAARERWGTERVGICVGSSTAAMDEIENAYSVHAETGSLPSSFDVLVSGSFDGLIQTLRALTGLEGPAAVISNACASSGKAFASAQRWLHAGVVDAVLVGGADSLCQITFRGFRSLGLLSCEPTRPFSSERRGINIGEGAAFALLERSGEGPRLLGVGESGDAHHMTTPDPEGRGAQRAMEIAISDAGVAVTDIDYVNAHGTGTAFNDAMEARAIRATLGARSDPVVVSTKGYVGHTLGAAGAIEATFVLESLQDRWIPGSVGADPLDPKIGLNIPALAVDSDVRVALSNSFAFGGSNVSLVFGAPE
jgi:3-oxoacyl-[acyl-carrier-protein] synthase-1